MGFMTCNHMSVLYCYGAGEKLGWLVMLFESHSQFPELLQRLRRTMFLLIMFSIPVLFPSSLRHYSTTEA